jgi:hypothetical protein
MLAFLGVLIWVGYTLMTNATRRSRQQHRGDQRARERHSGADARGYWTSGEIDAAEYQRLRGLIAARDDQVPAG